MITKKKYIIGIMLAVILGVVSCSRSESDSLTPKAFLKKYDLKVKTQTAKFNVDIPENWHVELGAYPEGLYWDLSNEFSKDAGLNLTSLKGETVEAQIYELEDGLPGEGDNACYNYPSNVILLVKDGKTVGAWLSFNIVSIGPSVTKKTLQDLTGLTFDQWVDQQDYFSEGGNYSDLKNLSPIDVLNNFFMAVNKGDKARAVACLSPRDLCQSLTVNLGPGQLYHKEFNQNNSLVENLIVVNPISYELYDPEMPATKLNAVENRTCIGIAVKLKNIEWKEPAFNSEGETTRFAVLKKYKNGWKLEGLGTGP